MKSFVRNWKHGGSQKFWAEAYVKSVYLQSVLAIYFPVDAFVSLVTYIALAHGFHVFYTASFWLFLSLIWALPPCFFVLRLYLQKRKTNKKKIYDLDDDLKDDYERDQLVYDDDDESDNYHNRDLLHRGINNEDEDGEDLIPNRKKEKKEEGFALDFIAEGYVEHRFVPTIWNGLGITACVFGVLASIMGSACNFLVKDVAGGVSAIVTLFTVLGCMYYIIHRSLDVKESSEMELEVAREETQQARQMKSKMKKMKEITLKCFAFLFGLLVVMVTILSALQSFVYAFNVHYYPPPGELVNIGGSRLMHLNCNGTNTGSGPTVILLHGWGGQAYDWAWVQPDIAQITRACSVDRSGYGWSDPPNCALCGRTAEQQAKDLNALLKATQIDKNPVIFVVYGDAVLDCVDPAKFRKVGPHDTYTAPPFWDLWRNVLPTGIPGVLAATNKLPGFEVINPLPKEIHPIYVQNQLKPMYPQSVVREYEYRPQSAHQANEAGDFGRLRFASIIAGKGFNATGVTSLSTNSSYWERYVANAPYDMHYHKVFAPTVVDQIKSVVAYSTFVHGCGVLN